MTAGILECIWQDGSANLRGDWEIMLSEPQYRASTFATQEWLVREEIATAVEIYNGTSSWWQRLLGFAPPVSLHLNLPEGAEHNVTWEEFAHATCLVRLVHKCLRIESSDTVQTQGLLHALELKGLPQHNK